ncbi:serine O-acetyltransferase [Aliarcobacter butzleri]
MKNTILSDFYRFKASKSYLRFLFEIFFGNVFKYIFWFRICSYLKQKTIFNYTLYPFARLIFDHYIYKFGISIPLGTKIDNGIYISHFGGIVIHKDVVIGKNASISHGVTIGKLHEGEKAGCPMIGDNIYIAPGAKIFGNIKIGNNVVIGANAVVINDIIDDVTVGGIPAKIISNNNSSKIVKNKV